MASRGPILSLMASARCRCIIDGKPNVDSAHNRTSSNTSAFSQKASPMRHSLSRAHRNGSLAFQRLATDAPEFILTGSADERENTVRAALRDKADQVTLAVLGSQQDKARTTWVRHWCVKTSSLLTAGYKCATLGMKGVPSRVKACTILTLSHAKSTMCDPSIRRLLENPSRSPSPASRQDVLATAATASITTLRSALRSASKP